MKKTFQARICGPNSRLLRMALLGGLAVGSALCSPSDMTTGGSEPMQADHMHSAAPARLVRTVRDATRQFLDVNNATGYGPFLGCVSGPDHGAMGVHYVNPDLVADNEIDATKPEALIYEPWHGRLRLVGVEFIVDAKAWLSHHDAPPVLEGQSFQFVNSPNRYALNPFFELHVWAWRDNPHGAFVDWNNHVTCEGR